VNVIRELVMGYYGASRAEWASVERALGVVREPVREVVQVDHWIVLGLSHGATRIEIKKAYHAKMLAYHPDKVAYLAEEFQELAHQKTIEIRASYEALLRVVG
jgi:DnaJ-domain-containing protein 1